MSPRSYNAKARLALACPVMSHVRGYPFGVPLPSGASHGAWLADHVNNLNWEARGVRFEAKAPAEVILDVRERFRALLGRQPRNCCDPPMSSSPTARSMK